MIGKYFSPLSGSTRILLAVLATSAIFVTGCSNIASTAPDVNPFTSAATLKGVVHGGNQPVSGATVSLYYAGHTGPNALAVLAATTTTANDGAGSFSFVKDPTNGNTYPATGNEFSCPTGSNPLVYVIAQEGTLSTTVTQIIIRPQSSSPSMVIAIRSLAPARSI